MNDIPPIPENENPESESSDPKQTEPASFDDMARSVREAVRTGSEDARANFEKAIPKAKEDLAKGVHDIAYGIAYVGAFGAALLKEVTPETFSEGVREGSYAGQKAAEQMVRDRQEKAERDEREGPLADEGPVFV